MFISRLTGFTLPELLVALTIMGLFAAFSIPKMLTTYQYNENKALVQQAAATMSAAYSRYQIDNNVTAGMTARDLTPYINYVALYTASEASMDGRYATTQTWSCTAGAPCVRLASGALITLFGGPFNGLTTTNAVIFIVDPDGKVTDATTNGPGKGVEMFLYATNGRVADLGSINDPTHCNGSTYTPTPAQVPPWFSWS